ncbi:MAG TPA: DUF1499 domain-containing protein [Gemmataceae bacterium]|nr:DUF1499 domain-containing protein [Gemmataceae bacterium]
MWQVLLIAAAAVALGGLAVLVLLSLLSRRRPRLGVSDGRLLPCSSSPNCVSSQADDELHRVAPLTYRGTAAGAMAGLKAALAGLPRARVAGETDAYLHVECRTALLRFVDDVEFLIDDARKVIHVRSASRVGYSDFGANRRRVEAIRAAFERGGKPG